MIFGFVFSNTIQVQAAGDMVAVFTPDPLFGEVNFLPGDSVFASIKVDNNSGEQKSIIVEAINVVNSSVGFGDKFGDALSLVIREGAVIRFDDTLTVFFDNGEFVLSDLNAGSNTTYDFFINFKSSAENKYQGKDLSFEILIGFQGEKETKTGDSGGVYASSYGGGSSNSGTSLTIINEKVASDTNCTEAVVSWQTSLLSTTKVIYGETEGQFNFPAGSEEYGYDNYKKGDLSGQEKVILHNIKLNGLVPDTVYYYRCVSEVSSVTIGYEKSFRTCDPGVATVKVLGYEGAPNLSASKIVKVDFANSGEDKIPYEVVVTNNSDFPAIGVIVYDELPAGFSFSSNDKSNRAWEIGDIGAYESRVIEYGVNIDISVLPGTYDNKVMVTSSNNDTIETSAGLEVRSISVKGLELYPTGFSMREFLSLVILLLIFLGTAFFIKKKYLIKK